MSLAEASVKQMWLLQMPEAHVTVLQMQPSNILTRIVTTLCPKKRISQGKVAAVYR